MGTFHVFLNGLSLTVPKVHEPYFVFSILFLFGLEVLSTSLLLVIIVFPGIGYLGVWILLGNDLAVTYIKAVNNIVSEIDINEFLQLMLKFKGVFVFSYLGVIAYETGVIA